MSKSSLKPCPVTAEQLKRLYGKICPVEGRYLYDTGVLNCVRLFMCEYGVMPTHLIVKAPHIPAVELKNYTKHLAEWLTATFREGEDIQVSYTRTKVFDGTLVTVAHVTPEASAIMHI